MWGEYWIGLLARVRRGEWKPKSSCAPPLRSAPAARSTGMKYYANGKKCETHYTNQSANLFKFRSCSSFIRYTLMIRALSQRPDRDNWPLITLYPAETSHTFSALSKTLKFYMRWQSDPYFRFYRQFPVLYIFEYISSHNWPIRAWDSSNWS